MSIIMFIVFLLTDISMVGVFAFVYSGKEEYSEGMVLGVHIPQAEINHEEVQVLAKKYKSNLKRFSLWNMLISTIGCIICFWNLSIFFIVWTIWLCAYLAIGIGFIHKTHREMYDIKMKHNWILEGNSHIVHIDTAVSSLSDKLPISHWWNLIVVVCIGVSLYLPQTRKYFGANLIHWLFPISEVFLAILFWGLHLWFTHRKNIVYSADSSVNLAMNRNEKRTWSVVLLIANYMNLLSWMYLTIKLLINQWLYDADYLIYIILQMVPAVVIIIGIVYMQIKRKEFMSMDSKTIVVDDDEYWKNGWYNNPDDMHLWVQDRMCSSNYSMNMAKKAAKIISVATAVFITVIVVGIFSLIISSENTKITVLMEGNQVSIKAAWYDTKFNVDEIKSINILDKIPEDDFTRTDGGATEKYLVGHFTGKETGKCMLYLYRDYVPVLEIKLADETIYVNSKNKNQVQEWYQKFK